MRQDNCYFYDLLAGDGPERLRQYEILASTIKWRKLITGMALARMALFPDIVFAVISEASAVAANNVLLYHESRIVAAPFCCQIQGRLFNGLSYSIWVHGSVGISSRSTSS